VAAAGAYLPLYTYEVAGFSVGRAGLIMAVIGLIGIPARILWARRSERLTSTGLPLAILSLGAVGAVILVVIAGYGPGVLLWAAALVYGATAAAWNAVAMVAIVKDVDYGSAGRVSGHVLAGFYLGLVIGPVPFGYAVDRTGSYVGGWVAVILIFFAAAVLAAAWQRSRRRWEAGIDAG
jgi:predicted MFS family arabinose efflux permease